MRYSKPHLPYDQQVRLLASRGLDVGREGDAVRALKRIGYYRLSAYTYPMRAFTTDDAGNVHRSDDFVPGARLADAVALHEWNQVRHLAQRVRLLAAQGRP